MGWEPGHGLTRPSGLGPPKAAIHTLAGAAVSSPGSAEGGQLPSSLEWGSAGSVPWRLLDSGPRPPGYWPESGIFQSLVTWASQRAAHSMAASFHQSTEVKGQERARMMEARLFADCSQSDILDFPGSVVVKNPPANAGDTGSSPGPGRFHMPWSN